MFKEGESTRIWVNGKITVCLERVGKGCKMMVRGVGRTLKIRDSRENIRECKGNSKEQGRKR